MELLIKPLEEAKFYVPKNKTYGIRISSEWAYLDSFVDFVESDNWVKISSYLFDDVWPGMPRLDGVLYGRETPLSVEKAGKILTDFQEHISEIEALLVVCTYGKNRSPSVAIALNDIFELGHDSEAMRQDYPGFRPFIYNTMLRAAKLYDIK
jgi:hypothetical protein